MPPALSIVVMVAMLVEASLGFGATVITVALGALVLPIERLLPAVVSLNLILSAWIAARGAGRIDWRLLGRRVLPAMALGLAPGMAVARFVDGQQLRALFAVLVVLLAALELARMVRGARANARPLPPALSAALLFAAGVVHGIFATGGPLAVYVLGREAADKGSFRATLAVLWLILNAALVGAWLAAGRYDGAALRLAASLVPALVIGIFAGNRLHGRLPEGAFRLAVYAVLLGCGVVLLRS